MGQEINSPGSWSGVANTLQDILAQKRADQHQKLVDSLNLVSTQAQMEDAVKQREIQANQLKDNAAYRNAELSNQTKDRASREKIAMAPARVQPPNSVAEYQFAKDNGYKGTYMQYQKEDANWRKQNSPVPNFTYAGTNPDNGRPFSGDSRTGGFVIADDNGKIVPYLGKAGAKPPANSPDKGITTADVNSFKAANTAVSKADENAPIFPWQENTTKKAAEQNRDSIRGKMINTLPTPELQADVRNIVGSPKAAGMPIEEIIAQLTAHRIAQGKPLTPAETASLQKTLPIVLGKF